MVSVEPEGTRCGGLINMVHSSVSLGMSRWSIGACSMFPSPARKWADNSKAIQQLKQRPGTSQVTPAWRTGVGFKKPTGAVLTIPASCCSGKLHWLNICLPQHSVHKVATEGLRMGQNPPSTCRGDCTRTSSPGVPHSHLLRVQT